MALIEPVHLCEQNTCKHDVARRFSLAAAKYDAQAGIQARIASSAIERLADVACQRLLDIGCGTGRHTAELGQSGADVTGVDLAPGMIKLATERYPQFNFRVGDAEQLPWQQETFDVVYSSMALQWCNQPAKALTEIKRVLSSGGRAELAIMVDGSFKELRNASQRSSHDLQLNSLFSATDWSAAATHVGLMINDSNLVDYIDQHDSLLSMLHSIKRIGAGSAITSHSPKQTHTQTHHAPLTRQALRVIEREMPISASGQLINTYCVLHLTLTKSK